MIDRKFASKQISRLAQMSGFPRGEDEATKELINAVERHAPDEKTAEEVISEFIEDADRETRCPMPGDIKRAFLSRLDDFRWDPDCPKCQGTGGIPVYRNGEYCGVARCNCLARRPAPEYRSQPGDQPVGELMAGIKKAAEEKRGA